MNSITIRKAVLKDAAEIANVHINSWKEVYKGLFPQSFLNEHHLFFKSRYKHWKMAVIDESQFTFVAQCENDGVVGFINGADGRDDELKNYGEVWCIYLLKKYHRQKIGFRLLKTFFDLQLKLGKKQGYLWILENNPTTRFFKEDRS